MAAPTPPAPAEPQFDVIADHGFDAFPTLANDPTITPFVVQLGDETRDSTEMPLPELLERLDAGGVHPSTSQPSPETYAERYRAATLPVLGVTVSSALSGSLNAADQGRALAPDVSVTLHDSGTVSVAQSFQVHAAMTARALGHDVATAVEWMRKVHAETEFFFTLGTLVYLQRGGRIGRVMATLGTMLDLKPIITVDKAVGAYVTVARARTWKRAIDALAQQVTARFGAGTPLRIGLVHGADIADAEAVLARVRERHPIVWSGFVPVGPALAVHVGAVAVGVAIAPEAWPWERAS